MQHRSWKLLGTVFPLMHEWLQRGSSTGEHQATHCGLLVSLNVFNVSLKECTLRGDDMIMVMVPCQADSLLAGSACSGACASAFLIVVRLWGAQVVKEKLFMRLQRGVGFAYLTLGFAQLRPATFMALPLEAGLASVCSDPRCTGCDARFCEVSISWFCQFERFVV